MPNDTSQAGMRRGRRPGKQRVRRYLARVPFFPSLITLGNAFCGFLAIAKIADAARLAGQGALDEAGLALVEVAALLVFLAMLFDGLDGTVARLTKQATKFGAQLDSLADAITFGVAPAVIAKFLIDMHQGGASGVPAILPPHPKLYYLCAALFALCAVMRLARYNVETPGLDEHSHREFKGLPSPAAAAFLTALVLFWCGQHDKNSISSLFFDPSIYAAVLFALPAVLIGLGLLMVSTLPYPHLLNAMRRGRSFPSLAFAVFVLILTALEWQLILLGICTFYLCLGPVIGLKRLVFGTHLAEIDDEDFEDEVIEDDPAFEPLRPEEGDPDDDDRRSRLRRLD